MIAAWLERLTPLQTILIAVGVFVLLAVDSWYVYRTLKKRIRFRVPRTGRDSALQQRPPEKDT